MCCLIMLHVDMLKLSKRLLVNMPMPMQKVKMENVFTFSMWKNHDKVILIFGMVFNLIFTSFFVSYIINGINLCDFL